MTSVQCCLKNIIQIHDNIYSIHSLNLLSVPIEEKKTKRGKWPHGILTSVEGRGEVPDEVPLHNDRRSGVRK